jgi:probable F420-dependent oxidoreductase
VALRLGLVTPVVSLNPRVARRWEVDAEADDLVEVAEAADLLGYHHLTCSEHVAVPAGDVTWSGAPRGTRYHDPAVTLSWLAARTTRIRLATHVLVAGYHHPVQVAKTYGTLDRLSGGRVVLGIGVGSSRTEFDLLGVPFQDRGARADDFLRALRAVWGRREPTYRGSHFDIDGVVVDPCATSPELRLWIGGRSARSLRRAVELGDGWVPFGLRPAQVAELLARARDTGGWSSRRRPFEVVLTAEELDAVGDPDGTVERLGELVRAGATIVGVRCRHESVAELVEQLEATAVLAREVDGSGR